MTSDEPTPRWGPPDRTTVPGPLPDEEERTMVTHRVYGSAAAHDAPAAAVPPPPGPVPPPPAPSEAPVSPPPPSEAPAASPGTADRGRTTIADEVVEQVIERVVVLAAADVAGVHRLHPDVDRFFGDADSDAASGSEASADPDAAGGSEASVDSDAAAGSGRAVSVALDDAAVTINIAIEVRFGHAVHQAVEALRASVIGSAERLLGLTVAEVNVAVAGVVFPADGS